MKILHKLKENDTIIIRSHGVSEDTLNILKKNKFNIIDATCPYVENIHKKVKKYYNLGYNIIIVGDKNHPEVIGINGWCNNSALIFKEWCLELVIFQIKYAWYLRQLKDNLLGRKY